MTELSQRPEAFIRPTPAGRTLGGVARRTREAIVLCEAAGFDVVVVETVGVGQSETAVAAMTDLFLLLLAPLAGDELQGIKRGVMELADIVLVNKADGPQADAAGRTVAEYRNALHLMRPRTPAWTPTVEACSALTGSGIAEAWERTLECRAALAASGEWAARRTAQAEEWLREEIEAGVHERLREDPRLEPLATRLEEEVRTGRVRPAGRSPPPPRRLLRPRPRSLTPFPDLSPGPNDPTACNGPNFARSPAWDCDIHSRHPPGGRYPEEVAVETIAKLFTNGRDAAVRIPKAGQFNGIDREPIQKEGDALVILPARKTWESHAEEAPAAGDDFLAERLDLMDDRRVDF